MQYAGISRMRRSQRTSSTPYVKIGVLVQALWPLLSMSHVQAGPYISSDSERPVANSTYQTEPAPNPTWTTTPQPTPEPETSHPARLKCSKHAADFQEESLSLCHHGAGIYGVAPEQILRDEGTNKLTQWIKPQDLGFFYIEEIRVECPVERPADLSQENNLIIPTTAQLAAGRGIRIELSCHQTKTWDNTLKELGKAANAIRHLKTWAETDSGPDLCRPVREQKYKSRREKQLKIKECQNTQKLISYLKRPDRYFKLEGALDSDAYRCMNGFWIRKDLDVSEDFSNHKILAMAFDLGLRVQPSTHKDQEIYNSCIIEQGKRELSDLSMRLDACVKRDSFDGTVSFSIKEYGYSSTYDVGVKIKDQTFDRATGRPLTLIVSDPNDGQARKTTTYCTDDNGTPLANGRASNVIDVAYGYGNPDGSTNLDYFVTTTTTYDCSSGSIRGTQSEKSPPGDEEASVDSVVYPE
jgi:hypothetical protein